MPLPPSDIDIVTVAEFKAFQSLTESLAERDDFIQRVITAMSQAFQSECDQILVLTTRDFIFDGHGLDNKILPNAVVTSAVDLQKRPAPTEAYEDVTDSILLETAQSIARLYISTCFSAGYRYKVTLEEGYAPSAIPEDIKLLCLEAVKERFLENERWAGDGKSRFGLAQVSSGLQGDSSATVFRPLSERIKQGLARYKRVGI